MYYFVPAWYNKERQWYDTTNEWSFSQRKIFFDDTVNQVRIFSKNHEQVQVIMLRYAPQIRLFFHQKGLLEVPMWSLFDIVQGVSGIESRPLDWRDLSWPENCEFVYSPFRINVLRDGRTFAQVTFSDGGYLHFIQCFNEDGVSQKERLVFDDRGFLSSILYYENNQGHHQDYLNSHGQWVIREYLPESGSTEVIVNPEMDTLLGQKKYGHISELIEEVLRNKLATLEGEDQLVVAADVQHNSFFQGFPYPITFSFFKERIYQEYGSSDFSKLVQQSNLLLTESNDTSKWLKKLFTQYGIEGSYKKISPYDTRFHLGESSRLRELIIYIFRDSIDEETYRKLLDICFKDMMRNEDIELVVGTYQTDIGFVQHLESELSILTDLYLPQKEEPQEQVPVKMQEEERPRARLSVIRDENDLYDQFQQVRILMDLGKEPDLFHQIAAISSGIPQINLAESDYVFHKENGYILNDVSETKYAMHYFLDSLSNWNKALVASVDRIAENTGPTIIEQWKLEVKKHNG
ncbi:accessory Sec system protein Asp1 [Streptococcus suis]|nr:accessory Sec system protein Asp1 [Streptococcus suis]